MTMKMTPPSGDDSNPISNVIEINPSFDRTARLLGPDAMKVLDEARVIIFGLGGVGSWAAETLVRTGIRHLTIVDADRVARSNINRQLPALATTVEQVKVDVIKDRLLAINPDVEVDAIHDLYDKTTADSYRLEEWDYIIDAIDSLSDKALLILRATAAMAATAGTSRPVKFYSSMGAALKMDPARIGVAEFWKVKGCPLAAALRRRFKKNGLYPARKFKCVYSDELVQNHKDYVEGESDNAMSFGKVAVNGSLMHITAIFGITLASLVIRDIADRK